MSNKSEAAWHPNRIEDADLDATLARIYRLTAERDEARAERDALQRGVVAATERAEAAEAERDALAAREEQVRAVVDDVSRWRGYGAQRPQLVAILNTAPAVSLARHDAEVMCPHWAPGSITLRPACTSCAAAVRAKAE